MATLKQRGEKFTVIYDYRDEEGKRKQKWETFLSKAEAVKFKKEIEHKKSRGTMATPTSQTVEDFLLFWASVHGKAKWSFSMYTSSMSLLRNHIIPEIGGVALQKLQPLDIEMLYDTLRTKKCGGAKGHGEKDKTPCLSSTTIRHMHTLLKTAFSCAVDWKLLESSPVVCDAPKKCKSEPTIWTPEMVKMALDDIKDHPMLHLAIHLAFICSLRNGETVALTWDDIDFEKNSIHICRTLQRVSKASLQALPQDELYLEFPPKVLDKESVLVLKQPKTKRSDRIVFMTPVLRRELLNRKAQVAKEKAFLGEEYADFNLVFSLEDGYPVEPKLTEKWFRKWQTRSKLQLPPLIFHELRHSSATYKLLASDGDVKLVQGDLGHASAAVSLDIYAHTQDTRRQSLSEKIAQEFYDTENSSGKDNDREAERLLLLLKKDPAMQQKVLEALYAGSAQKQDVSKPVSRCNFNPNRKEGRNQM